MLSSLSSRIVTSGTARQASRTFARSFASKSYVIKAKDVSASSPRPRTTYASKYPSTSAATTTSSTTKYATSATESSSPASAASGDDGGGSTFDIEETVTAAVGVVDGGANGISHGIKDSGIGELGVTEQGQDWTRSFSGMAVEPFEKEVAEILMTPLHPDDIAIKPDGLLYLPEIKYRRILNRAFGPGGWGLAPRSEHSISPKTISREYALICRGRFVSVARGEQDYFDPSGLATATEGCKSNALMRCCKDLGIASELWDPNFIRKFKKQYCEELFVEHVVTKRKKKLWKRKDQEFDYPYAKTR
ncbi:hypothetical protein DFQ26_009644 [Actinomortierella ambigua]|nr:hypothetical protein DFQ26_009644 [Actinomortierella ambigua]